MFQYLKFSDFALRILRHKRPAKCLAFLLTFTRSEPEIITVQTPQHKTEDISHCLARLPSSNLVNPLSVYYDIATFSFIYTFYILKAHSLPRSLLFFAVSLPLCAADCGRRGIKEGGGSQIYYIYIYLRSKSLPRSAQSLIKIK